MSSATARMFSTRSSSPGASRTDLPLSTSRIRSSTYFFSVPGLELTKPIGLLISCATPAASWPMEASFSDCSNWLWASSSFWIRMRCSSFSLCSARLTRSFSRSAASSCWVRSRTWFSSATPDWMALKSEALALMSRSARFIRAVTILFRRTISRWSAASCGEAPAADKSVMFFLVGAADGNAGKSLVDVDTAVLLAVGAEADRVVAPEQFADRFLELFLSDFQVAQDAVAAKGQRRRADFLAEIGESLLEVGIDVAAARHAQHDAFLDRAVEGQRAVRIGLLDRADVIGAVEHDDHRRRREMIGGQGIDRDAEHPRIFLGGRQAVDFLDDAVFGIGLGDDQALVFADEVLGLEDAHRQRRADQQQDGAVVVKGPVVEDLGADKFQIVAGRAAAQVNAAQRALQGLDDRLLAHRQAVDQQQREGARSLDGLLVEAVQQVAHEVLAARHVEMRQIGQAAGDGRPRSRAEADAGQALRPVAGGTDLAGRGAADHRHTTEQLVQFVGQGSEVVVAGAEKHDHRHVRLRDPGMEFPGRLACVAGTGMADAKGSTVSHLVSRPVFWSLLCLCAVHCAAFSDYPYSVRAVQRLPMAGKNSTLRQNHDTNGSNEYAGKQNC